MVMRSTNLADARLVIDRVEQLRKLTFGWDGERASAPTMAALDRVAGIAATLDIEPRDDGGVDIVIGGYPLATVDREGQLHVGSA